MVSLNQAVGRLPRWQAVGLCLVLTATLGVVDYYTAVERFTALLYLLAVSCGAWYVGRSFGMALSVICTVTALGADLQNVHPLNLVGEAGIFVAVVLVVAELKEHLASALASQQLVDRIINAIPARVFWKDKNLLYLGCNAAFARDAGFAGFEGHRRERRLPDGVA